MVAWPRLVDESRLRSELVRLLHDAGGPDLRIRGAIRLEVLPLPRVTVDRVVLGDRVGTTSRFEADRIDVEVEPLALLAGRIEPRRLQLVRPEMVLPQAVAALGATLLDSLRSGELAGLQRIDIVDGTVRRDGGLGQGWPPAIEALDVTASRSSGMDFHIEASAALAGEPVRLALTMAPLLPGQPVSLQLELQAGPREAAAALAFQGNLRPDADGPRLEGTARLDTRQGPLPDWALAAAGVDPAWASLVDAGQARLSAAPGLLGLSDLELEVPGGTMRGSLAMEFGPSPTFDLSLESAQLAMTPEWAQAVDLLSHGADPAAAWAGRVRLRLAELLWHGDRARGVQAELDWERGRRPRLQRLDASLPGVTSLQWSGAGPGSDETPFTGAVTLQVGELRRLLLWAGVAADELPSGGLTSLDLAATARIGRSRLTLTDLQARLDATQITGSADYMDAPHPRLDLALAADRLNTALYGMNAVAWPAWRDRLLALDGSIDVRVDRLSRDALRGQELHLEARLQAGQVTLRRLRLDDLGGADLDLRGSFDLAAGTYDLTAAAGLKQVKPLLRALRLESPVEIERLAPLRLDGMIQGGPEAARLDLTLAASHATASLAGTMGPMLDGSDLDLTFTATADETADLLEALGRPAPPERGTLGPVRARGTLGGDGHGPRTLGMQLAVGQSEIDVQAIMATDGARPRVAGTLSAPVLETGLLAALYETMALPLGFPPGRPWLWPGDWPRQPLDWQWLQAVDLDLALNVAGLRHDGQGLPGASARIGLDDGSLALSRIAAPVAGGRLEGTITLEAGAGDYAILGTDLRLRGARAEQLAGVAAPGSGLAGTIDVAAELAAEGRSIADLVGSLRGDGELALDGTSGPGPWLGRSAASPGPWRIGGPFGVAQGIVASAPPGMTLAIGSIDGRLDLSLDLLVWILDARVSLTLPGSPGSSAIARLLGPPGRTTLLPGTPAP